MAAAATAKLLELQTVGRVLLVLGRHVIALFALRALQNNVISGHYYLPQIIRVRALARFITR